MSRKTRNPRALQIVFLVLLIVSFGQVGWWIIDQVHYTRDVRDGLADHFAQDAEAANALLPAGVSGDEIARLFPHLVVAGTPPRAAVRPSERQALDHARWRRVNRYGWEGVFFLAVLAGGMVVIYRALQQDALLRRRQQNFIAAVSHEFKSPLASLRLSVDTLKMRDPPAESRARLVERMAGDLDRLETMMTNILDTARLEEGRAAFEPRPTEVEDVVRSAVNTLRERAARADVTLDLEIDKGLVVLADPAALRAVITNLVDNAVKSTKAAGGGHVIVRAAAGGRTVRIEIEDDGLGFEPSESDKIFQKFYRAGDELRRKTRGSGLGLYIVLRLIELARGTIKAHSAGPGQGATFTVQWPSAKEVRP